MGLIITLIIIGLVLLLAEILLIPGVGVAGILGVLSMGGSCYYAFATLGNAAGAIVLAINVFLLVCLLIYVLRANTWNRLALDTNIDSKVSPAESPVAVGQTGKAASRLAPIGAARFGDKIVEVKALEGMIDAGADIEVFSIEDGKIYVRPVLPVQE